MKQKPPNTPFPSSGRDLKTYAEEPAIGRAAKMSGMQFTPGPDEVLDMVEDRVKMDPAGLKIHMLRCGDFPPLGKGHSCQTSNFVSFPEGI